jgi:gamma-glutamylcyclotransferase (GGCT)/AIG2-like uncharacterized protein YtfP
VAADYLFVYGTLRRETASRMYHQLAQHCEYVTDATLQAKLFEVAGYPGAVESGNSDDRVHGELYRIVDKDLLLAQLDEYEACSDRFPQPHEYVRKKLPVTVAANEKIEAWVYVFNHAVTGLRQIMSGNYPVLKKD